MATSTQKQFAQAFQPMTAKNNQILQQWHKNGICNKMIDFPYFLLLISEHEGQGWHFKLYP